ncbi:MAG: AMP-binding protein, partial [Eubacteriales bacterium]|nr:AMP-binding protein [Eubacteriales bacterium]
MNHKEYESIKAKEWEYAVSRVEGVKNSKDPLVRYRDIRPIIDLKHMLETSVELYSNNPAFYVKEQTGGPYKVITYKEVKADVDALGTALISMGLKDKRIGIIGDNSYQWCISYLATVCGTGVVVPLDKELSGKELEHLVKEAEINCIIYGKRFERIFLEMKTRGETPLATFINMEDKEDREEALSLQKTIEKGKDMLKAGNREFVDAVVERDIMSVLLFTSGTTGVSKGVMLSHGNIVEDLMASPTLLRVSPEDM